MRSERNNRMGTHCARRLAAVTALVRVGKRKEMASVSRCETVTLYVNRLSPPGEGRVRRCENIKKMCNLFSN